MTPTATRDWIESIALIISAAWWVYVIVRSVRGYSIVWVKPIKNSLPKAPIGRYMRYMGNDPVIREANAVARALDSACTECDADRGHWCQIIDADGLVVLSIHPSRKVLA